MRIADEWVNQAATVTAGLGLLLLGAVAWGRHFQAPWNATEAAEVTVLHGQQVTRAPAEPRDVRSQPITENGGASKVVEASPVRDAGKAERGLVPDISRTGENRPAPPANPEKFSDANPDAGSSAMRTTSRPGADQREASWLSYLPD